MSAEDGTRETKSMLLNVGPSHPAMHGVIRLITELEGETVVGVEAEIGYLHRAFEKSCENSSWTQAIVQPSKNCLGFKPQNAATTFA
jgi:NADH:ubiquinone oxidoreductase subunit D